MLSRTFPRSLKFVLEATVEYKQVYVQSGVNKKKRMGNGEVKIKNLYSGSFQLSLKRRTWVLEQRHVPRL